MSIDNDTIYDSIKTKGYKKVENNLSLFYKEYKHINNKNTSYEYNISQYIYKNGINCPKPIRIDNNILVFEYKNIETLKYLDLSIYYDEVIEMLNSFNSIKPPEFIIKWEEYVDKECKAEFIRALNYYSSTNNCLKYNYKNIVNIYNNFFFLKGQVLVHNDFGLNNLGISDGKIICYDFEHVSLGPRNWDFAFLHCLINPYERHYPLDCFDLDILEMIICCLLIKTGRCIRKKNDISFFNKLLLNWINLYEERKSMC